jgi:hypothetical protein
LILPHGSLPRNHKSRKTTLCPAPEKEPGVGSVSREETGLDSTGYAEKHPNTFTFKQPDLIPSEKRGTTSPWPK